jgi:hypothetical protein
MKTKVPKTKLEVELTCDKILLWQENKRLKAHLQAALAALDLVLNEGAKKSC